MTDTPDLSIEDEVRAAMALHAEPEEVDTDDAAAPEADRDESGRFKAKDAVEEATAAEPEAAESPEEVAAEPDPYAAPPQHAKKAIREHWADLPSDVRADLIAREKEVHEGFTRFDEERQFGKRIKEVVAPYEPFIKSLGAEPVQAFDYLIKTDYALRTAEPAQRAQMFLRAAKDYGLDLETLTREAAILQENFNPVVETLQERIFRLESQLQSTNVQPTASVDADVVRMIEDFASKPENVHFAKVQPVMTALLESGQAQTLEEAYDRATYADPEIRALRLSAERETEERKRAEAKAAQAAAARKASVSVTGAPGSAVPTPPMESSGSLEDDIRNAIRAASGR